MALIERFKHLQKKFKVLQDEARRQSMSSVEVGYTAAYALYVHEAVAMKLKGKPRSVRRGKKKGSRGKYWDPQGRAQAKFLEEPARTMEGELGRVVQAVYKKTKNMEKALLTAGLRLQRESQQRCPVDTGNLKNSAFTRVVKGR